MKIFLDSANLPSIKKYNDMGLIDGITTNPTLLSKEKVDPADLMREIVRIVKGPVSLEVVGTKNRRNGRRSPSPNEVWPKRCC